MAMRSLNIFPRRLSEQIGVRKYGGLMPKRTLSWAISV
jgi:hypothetical protein